INHIRQGDVTYPHDETFPLTPCFDDPSVVGNLDFCAPTFSLEENVRSGTGCIFSGNYPGTVVSIRRFLNCFVSLDRLRSIEWVKGSQLCDCRGIRLIYDRSDDFSLLE